MEIEELRQVYNLQFTQVTECKVLLNCKFPMAKKKEGEYKLVWNMIVFLICTAKNACPYSLEELIEM